MTSHMPELEGATFRRVNNNPGTMGRTIVDGGKTKYSLYIVYVKQDREGVEKPDDEYFWSEEITQMDFMGVEKSVAGANVLHSVELEITTPLDQMLPWAGFETRSELAPTSRDPQCFEKIRTWIQECKTDHPDCKTSHSNQDNAHIWPRRLLDTGPLGDKPSLRLVENLTDVEYCALSYCWGNDPSKNFTTTAATHDKRKSHISMSDLPQTLQDAVVITREVGCRYVWVGTLASRTVMNTHLRQPQANNKSD